MKHVIDDTTKNKFEALDKSEVLAAIQQIIEQGEIPQELMNGVALTLRNPIDNQDYKIAFCTQAKYNELEAGGQLETNCYYFITDDNSYDVMVEEINGAIEDFQTEIDLLPRTQELMQSEAEENQHYIPINNMTDTNNWIEITGYVKENSQGNKYYFTQRLKVTTSGVTNRGQSIVTLSNVTLNYMFTVWCSCNYYDSNNQISVSLSALSDNITESDYSYKILSVKELINY